MNRCAGGAGRWVLSLLVTSLSCLAFCGVAVGQGLESQRDAAEASASQAEADIAAAEREVGTAEAAYDAATAKAVPANRKARLANVRVKALDAEISDRRQSASAEVAGIESDYAQAVSDKDEEVRGDIGGALAALAIAAIALGWGWLRASAPVTWLTERATGQAVGLCVFGGLVVMFVGAGISESGIVIGALGIFLMFLGPILAVALLLARHSARIQHGQANPIFKRERLPRWMPRALAGLMLILFLGGLGAALTADDPERPELSDTLRLAASEDDPALGERLENAESEAEELRARAAALRARQAAARRGLRALRRQVGGAEVRLVRANGNANRLSRRIDAVNRREAREAEELAEEVAGEAEEESAGSGCDPNYSGCLDPSSSDYDCAGGSGDGPDYTGPVQVIGSDPHGLDSDGDGYACEY